MKLSDRTRAPHLPKFGPLDSLDFQRRSLKLARLPRLPPPHLLKSARRTFLVLEATRFGKRGRQERLSICNARQFSITHPSSFPRSACTCTLHIVIRTQGSGTFANSNCPHCYNVAGGGACICPDSAVVQTHRQRSCHQRRCSHCALRYSRTISTRPSGWRTRVSIREAAGRSRQLPQYSGEQ